jgi:hypothetical protein
MSHSRILFILSVFDLDQGVEEQALHLGGAAAIEILFHGYPQVAGIGKQKVIQPEAFFHFPFDEVALDRVADLAVNGNSEAAGRTVVFQKV